MRIEAYGKTEKGLHLVNQDAFLMDIQKGLFAVADGVTSARNSERASHAAVDILKKEFSGDLEAAFFSVNENVCAMENSGRTTLTAVFIKNATAMVGHVGDSGLFSIMNEGMQKITDDDSMEGSDVLTQAIGQKRIIPHFYKFAVKKGDVIVLATDGVANYVDEKEMLNAIKHLSLQKVPSELLSIAKAKRKLYEDDKTVVVVKVT